MAAAGAVVAGGAPLWVLLVVALTGALSTDVVDNGPATTLEQVMLATEDAGTSRVYGRYNAAGAAAGALGALSAALPVVTPPERTAAAARTNAARYIVRPIGPLVAGAVQQIPLGAPLVLAGVVKAGYDLALWRWAGRLSPPLLGKPADAAPVGTTDLPR